MPNLSQEADSEFCMESPLDVLSRAASMVETRDLHANGEASLKRAADPKPCSPIHHHPRNPLKQERVSSPPSGHTVQDALVAENNRRCAGTQTSFSSFLRDGSPPNDMFPSKDSDCRRRQLGSEVGDKHCTAQEKKEVLPHVDSDHNAPLNLSKSGSSSPQHRPSVITCMARTFASHSYVSQSDKESNKELCDPAIEEHFRRSLGHMYGGRPQQPTTPEEPPAALPQGASPKSASAKVCDVKVVTVYSESVDDHFAKSLGDTWKHIKAKETHKPDCSEESVDDHFAKALGDAWHKIKEGSDSTSCSSSVSRSPSPSSQHFVRSLGDSWNPLPHLYGPSAPKRPRTDSGCSLEQGGPQCAPGVVLADRHKFAQSSPEGETSSSSSSTKCSPEAKTLQIVM